jgi:hypothetical protein
LAFFLSLAFLPNSTRLFSQTRFSYSKLLYPTLLVQPLLLLPRLLFVDPLSQIPQKNPTPF